MQQVRLCFKQYFHWLTAYWLVWRSLAGFVPFLNLFISSKSHNPFKWEIVSLGIIAGSLSMFLIWDVWEKKLRQLWDLLYIILCHYNSTSNTSNTSNNNSALYFFTSTYFPVSKSIPQFPLLPLLLMSCLYFCPQILHSILKKTITWRPLKHFLNFQKITTSSTYILTSLVHFCTLLFLSTFWYFHHSKKTTKILFVTPLQSPGTLEMPNTETNTSLAYRIGVQEYSWCFKVVCFMLAIQKVTFYKAYIFTSL